VKTRYVLDEEDMSAAISSWFAAGCPPLASYGEKPTISFSVTRSHGDPRESDQVVSAVVEFNK
jgi:hypothetical protein